jgi:predicted metal-dependent hydrolase
MIEPAIPIRNAHFFFRPGSGEAGDLPSQVGPEVPKHWHGGQRAVTTFFDNLSIFFPLGERFFISAVRAHQHKVTEPWLHADLRAFCGQEGIHSREHERYNAMLQAQGYPVDRLEKRVERLLGRARKFLPKRKQLAVTCALEHFTALMAHMLLQDKRVLEGAHPVMASLWKWHAAEENEHKSVAFDVYEAAGGTYGERCRAMAFATVMFWLRVFEHQIVMMKADGTVTSPAEWWSLFRFLFVDPGAMRGVIKLYFQYYRPGFHPQDIDSRFLIDAWKREFTWS